MKKRPFLMVIMIFTIFAIYNPTNSLDYLVANAISEQISEEPVKFNLTDRFIRFDEKTNITLEIMNIFEIKTTYKYTVSGSNLYFQEILDETRFQLLTGNLTINPGEKEFHSIFTWFTSIEADLVSSIQNFSVQVINTNTSEILLSKSDWIWLYTNYDDLTIPQIPRTSLLSGFPLFSSQDIIITYALIFNESASTGFIRWYIHNTVEVSQNYKIIVSNQSQFIRFDKEYVDGYVCSLVCGDSSFYNADFRYSLPIGASIAYIKVRVQIFLDDQLITNNSLLITLNDLKPITDISNEFIGTSKVDLNAEKLITIDISNIKTQNTDIVVLTKDFDLEKVIIPEYQIINGILSFSLTPEDFHSNFLLFIFNTTDYSSFEICKIHLVDLDRSSNPNGIPSSQTTFGFSIPILIFSLSFFVMFTLTIKKNR